MILENFRKSFDTDKVLRLLGAREDHRVSNASLRRIEAMTRDVRTMLTPQLSYRVVDLAARDRGGFQLAGGTRFRSPKMARALAKAETVCCFVATVGPVVDMEIQKKMKERQYAEAYVLDAIGSMSAEHVVEQFYQRMARKQSSNNGGVTLRFSPGYCDWPLQEQRSLFELFKNTDTPEIVLSDSCLMSPRKSISGLFGLLPAGVAGVNPLYNPCNTCAKRDCIARRSN